MDAAGSLSPFTPFSDRLQLRVRVAPKASANRIGVVVADETGAGWLQVAVTAVPEDGRANKEVIALLAKRWKLPKSALSVVRGATERRKAIDIDDPDPAALMVRLEALIGIP
ncbi:MAG: DUF167 domain-containing protein [Thalassobaculaceae bacterium]|nr:DUF167 domain-containing protein [Thalassobaculaceae bacterium]